MADLSIPNTFSSGQVGTSAAVNENFDAIETIINTTGVPVIQDGAVASTAKIADAVVTNAKLSKTPGQQVTGGYAQRTTDTSVAVGSWGTALSITITGDGSTPILIYAEPGYGFYNSTAANSYLEHRIHDAVSGSWAQKRTFAEAVGTAYSIAPVIAVISAFSGSKTFNYQFACSAGTVFMQQSGLRAFIRATWAPGYSNT